jgi:hypothetical protein
VDADDARLALVYSEALRALERQQQTLSEFAARSGNLLFTAAIVTAFLGGIALQDGTPTSWSWVAVGALAGVGAVHVSILWPRWTWRFRFQPQELLEEFVNRRSSPLDEMRRDLIGRIQVDLDANLRRLRLMGLGLQLSSGLFLIETFAWLVAVADR